MIPLFWTGPARDDLRRIHRWLTDEASSRIAARTLEEIGRRAAFLARFPFGGRALQESDLRALRVRDTPYLIIYRIGVDRIDLLRIRHEREDWLGE